MDSAPFAPAAAGPRVANLSPEVLAASTAEERQAFAAAMARAGFAPGQVDQALGAAQTPPAVEIVDTTAGQVNSRQELASADAFLAPPAEAAAYRFPGIFVGHATISRDDALAIDGELRQAMHGAGFAASMASGIAAEWVENIAGAAERARLNPTQAHRQLAFRAELIKATRAMGFAPTETDKLVALAREATAKMGRAGFALSERGAFDSASALVRLAQAAQLARHRAAR